MNLDLRSLQQQLKNGKINPVYLLQGEEFFLQEEALKDIKRTILQDAPLEFNFDLFYARDAEINKVIDAIETLPMMWERRLVFLKNAHHLKDKEWERLLSILKDPVSSCVFVLVCDKFDKRKKVSKEVLKHIQLVDLKKPFDNKVPPWIRYMAQSNQVKMSDEAVFTLQQFVGSNLTELNNEIIKIKEYIGERDEITANDILSAVSKSKSETVFDFAEAIGKKDKASALTCLANLMGQGQNAVGILAIINRHIRVLSSLHDGKIEGLMGSRLSAKAGIPSFFLHKYLEQLQRWDAKKIKKATDALYKTDVALKSSPMSSHIWLENFVLLVCR